MRRKLAKKTANVAYTVCRLLLGAVFVAASWSKILDPAGFAVIIANYQIVPPGVGQLAALFLPWLEMVCGLCLLINRWVQGAAHVVAVLMVVFMGALGYNMARGMDVTCGCFTLTDDAPASMWLYMIRDIILLVMTLGILRYRRPEPEPRIPASPNTA
jgi:uncharacterized membrane protein YphA (DoxX/SURF4 family)